MNITAIETQYSTMTGTAQLPLDMAKSIASLINIAESPKGSAPLLQRVQVELTENGLTASATDKYIVAIAEYWHESADLQGFYLDHDAAKFIASLKPLSKHHREFLTFELSNGTLTITNGIKTHVSRLFDSKFPYVESIFRDAELATEATPTALNLTYLSKFTKLVDATGAKIDTWVMTSTQSTPVKPGPVLLKPSKDSINIKGMIQPNIIK